MDKTQRFLIVGQCLPVVCALFFFSCGCGRGGNSPKVNNSESVDHLLRSAADNAATGTLQTSIRLREMTSSTGIDFAYSNGEQTDLYTILESLGGGVGMIDYDADGDADLFLTGGGEISSDQVVSGFGGRLFRNNSAWSFQSVSSYLPELPTYTHGVSATDFNNDGFTDLVVTGFQRLHLLRNQGDGTFDDVTADAGLDGIRWSTGAVFADVSGDGNSDLYVCRYVDWSFENDPVCRNGNGQMREVCSPRRFGPVPDSLFVSAGDGTFVDQSIELGLSEEGKGLGVMVADLDLDHDLDVYVANDTVPNFLYKNDGRGLVEQGIASGSALNAMGTPDGSMGVSLGDFNSDGRPDLWVTNFENESFALYRNEGQFQFLSVSQSTGVTRVGSEYVGWGTAFNDFDLDGDEDLFVSNGHVNRHPPRNNLRQLPILFENQGGARFVNVAASLGGYLSSPHRGRGLAVGDLDLDGDFDVVVSHLNERVELLENHSLRSGNWLQVRLVGTQSSRLPIGARVLIRTEEHGTQTRQLYAGGSYLSSSEAVLLIAVGENEAVEMHVTWPSGAVQKIADVPANGRTTIVEPPTPS